MQESSLADEIATLVFNKINSATFVPKDWLTHREAAEYLRMSGRNLELLLNAGKSPKCRRAGGHKRVYKRDELKAWLEAQAA